jgi:hypothetical protein
MAKHRSCLHGSLGCVFLSQHISQNGATLFHFGVPRCICRSVLKILLRNADILRHKDTLK